ncbi:hypothetical protein ABPG72_003752 [Tetrahymena utriculariae]
MEKNYTQLILTELEQNGEIPDTLLLANKYEIEHQELVGYLNSLLLENYITQEVKEIQRWVLLQEGLDNVTNGTPEFRVYKGIPAEGISKSDLEAKFDPNVFKFGLQNGMKKKWFKIKDGLIQKEAAEVVDEDAALLKRIESNSNLEDIKKEVFNDLKKRKIITQEVIKYFKINKGAEYKPIYVELESDLTYDMVKNYDDFVKNEDGTLKSNTELAKKFKKYNWNSVGKDIKTGNLHPLMKVRKQFREVLIEMGFEEMATNQYVESGFWNFDALFQPQQHPARDAHDTFFVREPAHSKNLDPEYWERVKKTHEVGGYGSIGYRYDWSYDEAKKNIFRTHTTAVSSKMLRQIAIEYAKDGVFKPRKFFSIDRVFRNESLDATHLAEFHQIEGVIADKNVGLGELLGVITEFFAKIGITGLKFKPTYNPYTEPSLEIHGFHPGLNKVIELGNSGVFRPEMLRPMGLPEDIQVLGWGLGLERPTMIQYKFKNIRDLLGYGVDMKLLKENPICCFKN